MFRSYNNKDLVIEVHKFGGSSIASSERIKNVATIIKGLSTGPKILVVSALGKMTNAFEDLLKSYFTGQSDTFDIYNSILQKHLEIARALFPKNHDVFYEINELQVEGEWILEESPDSDYAYTYDQIVSLGEMFSSKIICHYLQQLNLKAAWLDARDCIHTDNSYRNAKVDWEKTNLTSPRAVNRLLQDNQIIVTQGFIGGTSENFTTTLGREGSDYSGAIFSAACGAKSLTIWKDVPGVLTADPRIRPDAECLNHIDYDHALTMSRYGAKIIHPKTLLPLKEKNIPLYVKCFLDSSLSGTVIDSKSSSSYPAIYIDKENQSLIEFELKSKTAPSDDDHSTLTEKLAGINIIPNLNEINGDKILVCVNSSWRLAKMLEPLKQEYSITILEAVNLTTVLSKENKSLPNLDKTKLIACIEDTPAKRYILRK